MELIYNYREEIKKDILANIGPAKIKSTYQTKEAAYKDLYDYLHAKITGAPNDSYFWDPAQAERALFGNWPLLDAALDALSLALNQPIKKGPEWCDCVIRRHLLPSVLREVLKEIYE